MATIDKSAYFLYSAITMNHQDIYVIESLFGIRLQLN